MDRQQSGLLGRVAYLDGLRALAVLLVLADHAVGRTTVATAGWAVAARTLREGAHGVDLFFVLSGFCLSYPLLQKLRSDGLAAFEVHRFFAKRIVRIVPPYYAALAVLLVAAVGLRYAHVPLPGGMPEFPFTGWDVLKQALFLDWHTNFLNASFWTLAVELRWYLLFPLALALWIRAPRAFLALAAASSIAYAFTRMHAPDVGVLLPFLLGIVAADFHARGRHMERGFWLLVPACVIIGVFVEPLVWMPSPYGVENATFVQTNPAWQIAMFALVVVAGNAQWLRSALSFRPLVAIGTASYSIYLIHEPVVAFFQEHVLWPGAWRLAAGYCAAVAAGMLFWFAFERVWMYGSVKSRAITALSPRIAALFTWLGIRQVTRFASPDALFATAALPHAARPARQRAAAEFDPHRADGADLDPHPLPEADLAVPAAANRR